MSSEIDILQRERIKMMPVEYQAICKHVAFQLDEFNKVSQTKILTPQNNAQANIIQKKISTGLTQTEEFAAAKYHGCETVSNWMNILQIEQESFEGSPQDSDGLVSNENAVILTYRGNAVELKALETEVQEYLRRLINTKETPMTIRLDKYLQDSKANLATRQDMLKRISKQIDKQENLFKAASNESKKLNEDNEKYNTMLTTYSASENYGIIQKAKKLKIMIDDWQNRKAELSGKISDTKSELENYQSLEKANTNLTKADLKNTDSLNKLKTQFEETIRSINEESSVEDSRNTTMMTAIQKDLGSIRGTLLSRERKQTSSEISKCKSQFDRLMNRIKKQTGSMKKQTEKALKAGKEGPSEEQCSTVLDNEHEKDMNYWGEIFTDQKKEFQDILDSHLSNLNHEKEEQIKKITEDNANKLAILQSKKERLTVTNSEREIEYESVHERIESTEGILNDLIEQFNEKSENENDLKNMSANARGKTDSVTSEIRRKIESMQTFIDNATLIKNEINRILKDLMKKTSDYQKVSIPIRSKSTNAVIDEINRQNEEKKKNLLKEEEENEEEVNSEEGEILNGHENFEEETREEEIENEIEEELYEYEERIIENDAMLKDCMMLVDGKKYTIIERDGQKFFRIRVKKNPNANFTEGKQEDNKVIYTDEKGEEKELLIDDENVFYDDNGNKLLIDENGKIIVLSDPSKFSEENTLFLRKNDGTVMTIDSDGKISIVDPDGNQTIYAKDGTKTVFGSDGNKTVFDQKGEIIPEKTIKKQKSLGKIKSQKSDLNVKKKFDQEGNEIVKDMKDGKQIIKDKNDKLTLKTEDGTKIKISEEKPIKIEKEEKAAIMDSSGEVTIVENKGSKTIVENNGLVTVVDSLSSDAVIESDGDQTTIDIEGTKAVVQNSGVKKVIEENLTETVLDENTSHIEIDKENKTKTVIDNEGNKTFIHNITKTEEIEEKKKETPVIPISEIPENKNFFVDANGNQIYIDDNGKPVLFNVNSESPDSILHVKFVDKEGNEIKLDPSGAMVYQDKKGNKTILDKEGKKTNIDDKTDNVFVDKAGNRVYLDSKGNVIFVDNIPRDSVFVDKQGNRLIIKGKSYQFERYDKKPQKSLIVLPGYSYSNDLNKKTYNDTNLESEVSEEFEEDSDDIISFNKRIKEPSKSLLKERSYRNLRRKDITDLSGLQKPKTISDLVDEDVLISEEERFDQKEDKTKDRTRRKVYKTILASASSVSLFRPYTSGFGTRRKVSIPIVTPFKSYCLSSMAVEPTKTPRYVWVRKTTGQLGVYEPKQKLLSYLRVYNFQDRIWKPSDFRRGTMYTRPEIRRLLLNQDEKIPIQPIVTPLNLSQIIEKTKSKIFVPKVNSPRNPVSVRNLPLVYKSSPRPPIVLTKSDERNFEPLEDTPLITIRNLSKDWIEKEIAKKGTNLI